MSDPVVVIPARMAAQRLPGKPMADICGEQLIVHVWRRAMEAGIGPVIVATDEPAIVAAIERAGGTAIMTRADHPSGSDRIFEAVEKFDPAGRYDIVVNVRGGGLSGQAGAVKHGITRALLKLDAEYRPALKKAGHITRDSREVERKKYGLAGARRRFQFSKR